MIMIKRFFQKHYKFYIWFISVASILSISWLGDLVAGGQMFIWFTDVIYELFPSLHPLFIGGSGTLLGFICLISMSLFFTKLLYQQGQEWFRPITSLKQAKKEPVKALLLNVSPNDFYSAGNNNELEFYCKRDNEKIVKLGLKSLDDDNKYVDSLPFTWNWQPMMRSILANHSETLKDIAFVYTIGAKDKQNSSTGTITRRKELEEWITKYTELEGVTFHSFELDIQKADIENIYMQYCDFIEDIESKGVNASDIVVGVTGGTTDMSIAASMATLHKKTKFEYLSQIDRKLHKYNLAIQRPLE